MFNLGHFFNKNKDPKYIFFRNLKKILGFKPKHILIFKTAFTHKSKNLKDKKGISINYERLEFLGDSVLQIVISEYLFKTFPNYDEGDLTKLRSKIVNRENLNSIGFSLELIKLTESNLEIKSSKDDIHGNILESLIGAIYVDRGFKVAKNFIIKKIIEYHIDVKKINSSIISFKGALIEWSQKNKQKIIFKTEKYNGLNPDINFSSTIFLNNNSIAKAVEISKKKAEEKVAKRAYHALKLNFINLK